ncbi:MAG: phosphatase PAP2 family protein [Patescibacteria group bacterium]
MNFIDQAILNFLVNNRTEWLSFLMMVFTYSGGYLMVIGITFLSALSFYIHRHYQRILPLLITIGGSAGTVYLLKHLFYRARPVAEALYLETSSSFPSGHATMAMALYGFIFYIIWSYSVKDSRDKHHSLHKFLIIFLAILILLVGVSRLYLGVHYLSDVLAGYVIGLVWLWISHLISKLKIWPLQGNEHL